MKRTEEQTADKQRAIERLEDAAEAEATRANRGIPAPELNDEELREELHSIYRTRADTFFGGSGDALRTHTQRMLELEEEYARRFPEEVRPDEARTRAGSRERAGQPPDGGQEREERRARGTRSEGVARTQAPSRQATGQQVDDYGRSEARARSRIGTRREEVERAAREVERAGMSEPSEAPGTTARKNPNAAAGEATARASVANDPEAPSVPAARADQPRPGREHRDEEPDEEGGADVEGEMGGPQKRPSTSPAPEETELPETRPPADS